MLFESAQSVLEQLAPSEAEEILTGLAQVFLSPGGPARSAYAREDPETANMEAQYRTLLEQIPAVVFMVYLDRGVGEAYVSPQIEALLGFSREEWLEDPVRWYERIHPDDKGRWSAEAAEMFLSGRPLRSVYRVIARDGRTVSFQCDAKMVRRSTGQPWFIHGVGFDITDLKQAERALQDERNFATAVLDTVGALVVVLDTKGRIVRFNRACERTTGYTAGEATGESAGELLVAPEDAARFREIFDQLRTGRIAPDHEIALATRTGARRIIAWSSTALNNARGALDYVILTGIDVTEAKRLQRTVLEISGREQRRIGQDLHDGLGQHLTGVAFMSKVLAQKLLDRGVPEAVEAGKIVALVNQAIDKTRELSRGLLPVLSDSLGLMGSLGRMAVEIEDLFHVSCRFECSQPVPVKESDRATHLYHIAQEAVNNAIKHGHPQKIVIRLAVDAEGCSLSITDDGRGICEPSPGTQGSQGMGLLIMSYRAKMAGGGLEVLPGPGGGTTIRCTFPASNPEKEAES